MSHPQSAFLRLPAELRHEIYSYVLPNDIHMRLQGEKCFMAACIEYSSPWHNSKWADGYERERSDGSNLGYHVEKAVFVRRLQSTWGPHWMCEENAFGWHPNVLDVASEDTSDVQAEYRPDLTLLLVCTSMYYEVCDLLVRTSVINITDLDTLDCLDERLTTTAHGLHGFSLAKLGEVNRLSITLRLPLHFFEALECLTKDVATSSEPETMPVGLKPWSQLGSSISQLKRLTKVEFWLDYYEEGSWSIVSERALLDPLLNHLASEHSSLEISVVLPMLHPKFEKEERHYVNGELPGNARLRRVVRQSYHAHVDAQGHVDIRDTKDFPILRDMVNYFLEEAMEDERKWWKEGKDVEAILEDLIQHFTPCQVGML